MSLSDEWKSHRVKLTKLLQIAASALTRATGGSQGTCLAQVFTSVCAALSSGIASTGLAAAAVSAAVHKASFRKMLASVSVVITRPQTKQRGLVSH